MTTQEQENDNKIDLDLITLQAFMKVVQGYYTYDPESGGRQDYGCVICSHLPFAQEALERLEKLIKLQQAALERIAEDSATCMNSEHGGHQTCLHNEQAREDLLAHVVRLEAALLSILDAAESLHNNFNRPASWDAWRAARSTARARLEGRDA